MDTPHKAKKPEDKFIKHTEYFDRDRLRYIIDHQEEFKGQMRNCLYTDPNYDPFMISRKYLNLSRFCSISVDYK